MTRTTILDRDATVAQLVLESSACAPVFQRHKIDFCCRGGVKVDVACAERGLDPALVWADLERAVAERTDEELDPRTLSTAALIAHIVARHHAYLRRVLPFVRTIGAKVARVHGDHDDRLRPLEVTIQTLADALEPHLDQEEEVLFPALMARDGDRTVIRRELATMHDDHLAVGALLATIRQQTGDFAIPDWACNSYRALFAELEALEADILRHVHLENHVLMPRFAPS
jgi:regulator of cell morphogenesis and NO signaling